MNTTSKILEKVQEKVDDLKAKVEKLDFDKVQEKVDDFKAKIETLDMRYTLGRNEARDTFDREWHHFTRFVEEQKHRIYQQGFFAQHTLNELDKVLPELQALLKDQIPAKESAALQWRERLMRSIYEMEYIIRELYPALQDDGRTIFSNLRIQMELYRARLTVARLEEWNNFPTELNAVLAALEAVAAWRTAQQERLKKRLEDFGKDIGEQFEKVKGQFAALFN